MIQYMIIYDLTGKYVDFSRNKTCGKKLNRIQAFGYAYELILTCPKIDKQRRWRYFQAQTSKI